MKSKVKWHRDDLSLRTVLRVYAMSRNCEPIKGRYTEDQRRSWFADTLKKFKGRDRLAWTGVPEYQRIEGFSVKDLNDRHYVVAATSIMQGWEPVRI